MALRVCDNCLLITVRPDYVDTTLRLIRMSGFLCGASREIVEERCMLFQVSRSAFYIPPAVKDTMLAMSAIGIPVFDWRNN